MASSTLALSAGQAQAAINGLSSERCDLDVLLRDEWRHRVVPRDDAGSVTRQVQRVDLTGDEYRRVAEGLGAGASLASVALASLHTTLSTFGHGTRTVVAWCPDPGTSPSRVLPLVVDHVAQSAMTCRGVAEQFERALDTEAADAKELVGRGLFDCALVSGAADADLPSSSSIPLVAGVHDDAAAGRLTWTLAYPAHLFDDTVMAGVLAVLREVFVQYVVHPERPVRDIALLPVEQRRRLQGWNETGGEFPQDTRLEQLFEECARRWPDREAVVFRDTRLTYRELDGRANQLANQLIGPAAGVRPRDLVALCLDKSELSVIATFGIWKAGAAYVPLDPAYPAERIKFTIGDARPSVVVTNRRHADRLRGLTAELAARDARYEDVAVVEIEALTGTAAATAEPPRPRPADAITSGNLAYVTYTSGTTGAPKGVPKEHRSVVNSITDLSQRYGMREPGTERVALFASSVFEPHLRQILIALINAQTLVVVPDDVRLDPDLLPAYLARHGVTYLNATGSVLAHFDLRAVPSLTRLLLVGEELTSAGLRRLRERFAGHIVNEYAFTESAFVTAIKEFPPGVSERTDRSLGRPLRNVTWYVLSQDRKQLPIGAVGELYIGGCGVAPGYLNQDELTAGAFFDNPFRTAEEQAHGTNARIYRTGDLARMLPTGDVEYLGRADFQLKINGVRIEPGEIEARAAEHPGVRRCVVVPRETAGTGDRYLVGYYTVEPGAEVTEETLLAHLRENLIPVMVPARMVGVDDFPVNVNGKVDWRALPEAGPAPAASAPDAPEASSHPDASLDSREDLLAELRHICGSVLGVDAARVSATDDFFSLGGHSISCILLIARIRQRLRRAISVSDVFRLRTLDALADHLWAQPPPDPDEQGDTTPVDTSAQSLPANGLQQGLLYHSMKETDGDDAYVVQSVYRYHTAIRPDLMQQAWQLAQRRYPSLRLRFEAGTEPQQVMVEDAVVDWRFVDLAGDPDVDDEAREEERIAELLRRDRAERYRPTGGHLFRVYLIRQAEERFTLAFSCHHIIIDGWSLPVLHDQVHRFYLDLLDGKAVDPGEDVAYLAAQHHWRDHRNDHVDYWTRQIEQIDERGDLSGLLDPHTRYKVALRDYDHVREHASRQLRLGTELTGRLAAACRANGVTMHSVLQFVWHRALHAFGGGRTTVVGTIVSGRNLPVDGIESSVGLFINTLPLVIDHDDLAPRPVAEAVAGIETAVQDMNDRSIVELGRLESGAMKRQLFDTLLVLENYPRLLEESEERRHRDALRYERFFDADRVDHPLVLVAREEGDGLTLTLWYAGELFAETAIGDLLETTKVLFEQVADDMGRTAGDLELLSPAMVETLEAWNRTEETFPADATLHAVFEQAAATWPDAPAVAHHDTVLTYRQLNERANQLAHHLRSLAPLRPDDLVALVVDKNELMMVAILAVWKAGAAYVPIGTDYPDERVAFMLDDTDCRFVLTNERHADRLRDLTSEAGRPVVALEGLDLADAPVDNPVTTVTSTDLAYAIYTSGTTGRPKAVLVEHRGVVNLQTSMTKLFDLDKARSDEAVLSFSNYVFDHFVEQMTDALLSGQKLVILDDEMRTDGARLCRYINEHQVTYLSGTPSVLSLYDYSSTTSLRRIDAIGEDFTEPVFDKIRSTFPGVVINGYGPTEISITSHKRVYPPGERRTDKSIGLPVANTACYVLSDTMKRVPVGGIGELYIGGIGVTRGYLNRPELTAERFLDNPFRTPQEEREGRNARMYRTGDLARWLPNGELEYLGRTDLQVKIRGQRVELGEIESVLASCPGVTRALVVARDHAASGAVAPQKYLVGFYLGDPELTEDSVLEWMRGKLVEALVPSRVVRIDDIPVTPSGKLDVGRLPDVEFGAERSARFVAPSSDVELRVCRIWADVLGIAPERIGAQDDFFALGGDSIRAMALAQAMTSAFGRDVGIAAAFRHTTIAAQARHLEDGAAHAGPPIRAATAGIGAPPVSLAQERLLFIDEYEGGTAAYNVPFCLRLPAVPETAVADALRTLVDRHAALRTLLRADADGVRRQHVTAVEDARIELPGRTVGTLAELDEVLLAEERHVFRLAEELPLRAAFVTVGEIPDERFLSLVFHHTCIDGFSWDILRRELLALLDGEAADRLPPPRATYADFAVWQRESLTGAALSTLVQHWTADLEGVEALRLPLDRPRPARFDYRGRELPLTLDGPTTEALRELARSAQVSLYSVLLAAWCLTLRGFTGQEDLVVGTPYANRGQPEFNDVVGLLANLLAVRVQVDRSATVDDYILSVGASVVAAQVHADLPFEQLVKELGAQNDPSRHPLVQANFTLLPGPGAEEQGGVGSEYRANGDHTSVKFDLSAILYEHPDGVEGTVTYAASLFEPATVTSVIATFHHVVEQFAGLATEPGGAARARVADITWVDEAGPVTVAAQDPRRTAQSTTGARGLHHLFEQAVAEHPDEVAVACGGQRVTYRELDERSNRLAHRLRATVPLGADDLVGLVLDRTERMIVALLAVWKAGAAYVPVDPSYPDDRIAFVLEDTEARLVLVDDAHAPRLRRLVGDTRPVLAVEDPATTGQPTHDPEVRVRDSDLAYAIYTSGTTGQPKAVLVRHGDALSFHESLRGRYFDPGARPRQGVALLANYVFDFSIEQLALSILSGHKLIIPPELSDPDYYAYVNREGLTYVSGTPTQIHQLDLDRLPGLGSVLVAGEAFAQHHFEKIRREYSGPLFNAYGTTETTVYNTVRRFAPGDAYRDDLGTPLGNTRLYVLDDALRPVPPGAPGELHIAGPCVSAGYLHRPELTAQRFVANHLRSDAEERDGRFPVLYRTGDIVRSGPDGELRYLGRNDTQVKIRGLRIELGEVEAAIAACPGVQECAVIARDDDRSPEAQRLVGYYVPEPAAAVDDDTILEALRATLTRHMIPSLLVRMDGPLPTNVNGKLDIDALPRAEFGARQAPCTPPRTRLDAKLCQLWDDALPVDGTGIDDDFFRRGGDSINALHLASRIQRETGHAVSVKDVFDHPTVRAFVDNALAHAPAAPVTVDDEPPTGPCPLLPIQRWFFAKSLAEPGRFNQNFAVQTPPLDVAKLRTAFRRLVDHHDAFHLRYRHRPHDRDGVEQFYATDRTPPPLHTLDVSGLSDEEIRAQLAGWQHGFDLEHGPIACAAYLHGFADGRARIWFAVHHLVVDAVSWGVLTQDLEILYHGGATGPRTATFGQWTRAAERYSPVGDENQLWEDLAEDVRAGGSTGWPATVGTASRRTRLTLPEPQTQALLTESGRAYDTDVTDLLLAAVGYALAEVTGRTRNHVTVEGHGRELFDGAPDVHDTVGWFTTMHPVVVDAHPDPGASIRAVRDHRRRVPHHGIGYGLLRGTYGGPAAPLPPISVNYLGRSSTGGGERDERWRLDTGSWLPDTLVGGDGASDTAVDVTMRCVDGRLVTDVDSRWDEAVTRRFAAELERRLAELVEHTSSVARSWRRGDGRADHERGDFVPFILSGEDATGRPLFVLPPGEGGAESYLNNLAKRLTGHPLVLFNNLHLHTPGESFEELGAYYLDHIRRIQPSGPYSLLGWSFGGVLAVELARALALSGETIEHLLLIDPYFDVLGAQEEAGLTGAEGLLDPINYRYAPSRSDLERLDKALGDLVLFKACEPNEITTSDDQRRLFESYLASRFNHLDSLLPDARITVVPLHGRTHHDWVSDPQSVGSVSETIEKLLAGRESRHLTDRVKP
jgi:N-(5-amino-5-carboxypentanoyl)-L-cysteinyl-D-valine synthase